MKIKTITVRASRTLPHPSENYANFRADIELTADLEPADTTDIDAAIKELQRQAETTVEQHCSELKAAILAFGRYQATRERTARIEHSIQQSNEELQRLRAELEDRELPLFDTKH